MANPWLSLDNLQLGKYAEYFVKMEFTLRGFSVFSAEVDDRAIDLVVRKNATTYYDVQVKSLCRAKYIFIPKRKIILNANYFVAVATFFAAGPPKLYLIPSLDWNVPNSLLRNRAGYEEPEWGINVSSKSQVILDRYAFDKAVTEL
jgi:hypothetical protein